MKRHLGEHQVLLSPHSQLRKHEIMDFEAPTRHHLCLARPRRNIDPDESLLPSSRGVDSLGPDPVREVAECLVERRAVAESTIDLNGPLRIVLRVRIGLERDEERFGCEWELAKDCLAADNNDL